MTTATDNTHADQPLPRITPQHLALALYSPLFAERDTIKDAYNYASSIAKATDNPAAVMTAVHVLLNTIAKELEKMGTTNPTQGA